MSVQRFLAVLKSARLAEADRVWFGRWLSRYAVFLRQEKAERLDVTEQLVIEFSRSLLANGVAAWQRLQGVRAIEFYRTETLGTDQPDLLVIKQALQRRAAAENGQQGKLSEDDKKELDWSDQRGRALVDSEDAGGASPDALRAQH